MLLYALAVYQFIEKNISLNLHIKFSYQEHYRFTLMWFNYKVVNFEIKIYETDLANDTNIYKSTFAF